jgi:hypothetical protein
MTVTQARAELEAVLMEGGLRVLPAGAASPPSVFVTQGTPWTAPAQLGARARYVRWVIVGIVAPSSEASIAEAEALAEQVDLACAALPGPWGMPTVETPGLLVLAGTPYLAFRATIETVI